MVRNGEAPEGLFIAPTLQRFGGLYGSFPFRGKAGMGAAPNERLRVMEAVVPPPRPSPGRGGRKTGPRYSPRVIFRCHSGWLSLAQPSVTVPRVIARIVPLTQMAA